MQLSNGDLRQVEIPFDVGASLGITVDEATAYLKECLLRLGTSDDEADWAIESHILAFQSGRNKALENIIEGELRISDDRLLAGLRRKFGPDGLPDAELLARGRRGVRRAVGLVKSATVPTVRGNLLWWMFGYLRYAEDQGQVWSDCLAAAHRVYFGEEGELEDPREGKRLYLQAARLGSGRAMHYLFWHYSGGEGSRAIHFFRSLTPEVHLRTLRAPRDLIPAGIDARALNGKNADLEKARKWGMRAGETGILECWIPLAHFYESSGQLGNVRMCFERYFDGLKRLPRFHKQLPVEIFDACLLYLTWFREADTLPVNRWRCNDYDLRLYLETWMATREIDPTPDEVMDIYRWVLPL